MLPLTIDQLSQFASDVASVLEAQMLPYYVSNPLASSLLGYPLAHPNKLILIAAISPEQVSGLTANLIERFFVNPADIQQAVHEGSGFALRHLEHHQTAEIWLQQPDEFSIDKMERRIGYSAGNGQNLWLCSPEDAILDKLLFEIGGRSHPGWTGLIELLRIQSSGLDYAYLGDWSVRLGLSQLVSAALLEAEI